MKRSEQNSSQRERRKIKDRQLLSGLEMISSDRQFQRWNGCDQFRSTVLKVNSI